MEGALKAKHKVQNCSARHKDTIYNFERGFIRSSQEQEIIGGNMVDVKSPA